MRALGGAASDGPPEQEIVDEMGELLSAMDAVVWSADPTTMRVVSLTGGLRWLGHGAEAWRSERFWETVLDPNELPATMALWRATATDGRARNSVHRVRTLSGEQRWVDTRVRVARGPDERVRRVVGLMVDITEQRRAAELIAAERAAELVLEQLPAIVYAVDRDLRFTWGGGAGLARLGLKPQQLRGVSIAKYLQTDDPEHPELRHHRRALAGESLTYDSSFHGATFEVHLRPLHDQHGGVLGVLGVAIDVTDLRRVELARAESEDRFRRLADASFEGILLHEGGRILLANQAFASMFGYTSAADIVGRSVLEFTHPESRAVVLEHVRLRSESSYRAKAVRCDGSTFMAEIQSKNGRYRDHLVRVTAVRDISEQLRAETEREGLLVEQMALAQKLQRRVAEWEGVLASVADGVTLFDANGLVTFMNRAARQMLGATDSNLQRPISEWGDTFQLRPNGHRLAAEEMPSQRVLRGETLPAVDVGFVSQTGVVKKARVSAAPIRLDGNVVGGVMISHDITAESRRAEEVAEFERLKDQFIRVAAHELKTPVAVMKGYAQFLLRCGDAGADRAGALSAIVRGSDRIDRVVQELVDISQQSLGTMALAREPMDLSQLVFDVTEVGRGRDPHHVHLKGALGVQIRGDAYRLRYVITNLLDNAIRYSPAGGDVDVDVSVADGRVTVTIVDHGVGIPTARQARIFERFYRAHTDTPFDYGGIGVGLSISREIIRRHGGDMDFVSVEGVGSTFRFWLPVGAPPDAAAEEQDAR